MITGLIASHLLLLMGILGCVYRKNLLMIIISFELILLGAILNFCLGSAYNHSVTGSIMTMFAIAIAAIEATIGLALLIKVNDKSGHIESELLNKLGG